MKLNLLFVIMYVLTLLVYPIVFMYDKLRQLSMPKENVSPVDFLVNASATPGE